MVTHEHAASGRRLPRLSAGLPARRQLAGAALALVLLPVVTAVLALLRQRPWLAWLAAALGVFALELYCFEARALVLLLGCLRLLRLQARAAPIEQHRQRQQQIQSQP